MWSTHRRARAALLRRAALRCAVPRCAALRCTGLGCVACACQWRACQGGRWEARAACCTRTKGMRGSGAACAPWPSPTRCAPHAPSRTHPCTPLAAGRSSRTLALCRTACSCSKAEVGRGVAARPRDPLRRARPSTQPPPLGRPQPSTVFLSAHCCPHTLRCSCSTVCRCSVSTAADAAQQPLARCTTVQRHVTPTCTMSKSSVRRGSTRAAGSWLRSDRRRLRMSTGGTARTARRHRAHHPCAPGAAVVLSPPASCPSRTFAAPEQAATFKPARSTDGGLQNARGGGPDAAAGGRLPGGGPGTGPRARGRVSGRTIFGSASSTVARASSRPSPTRAPPPLLSATP